MKTCKKFLHLLNILFLCVPLVANAQTFKTIDFERLLLNHPLMKNFDPATGRFRDTPSEIVPIAVLQQKISSMTTQISDLEKQKAKIVAELVLKTDQNSEEIIWQQLKDLDSKIETVKKQMQPVQKLLEQGGVPGYETVFAIATQLVNDIVGSRYEKNHLVVNKLPRFRSVPPALNNNDLRRFFDHKNIEILEKYLSQAGIIGLMFSHIDQPVLYSREGAPVHEVE